MNGELFQNRRMRGALETAAAVSLVGLVSGLVVSFALKPGFSGTVPTVVGLLVSAAIFFVMSCYLFLTVMAAVHIFAANRSSVGTRALWLVFIVFIPPIGGLVYYFAKIANPPPRA
jgi:hypothetical protein